MNNIILAVLAIIFLTSCLAGTPIMNNSVPCIKNKPNNLIGFGVGKMHSTEKIPFPISNKGESTYSPVLYISSGRTIDDVFSFELFPFGAKLLENLFKGSFLYISTFQSVYLLGVNYGAVISTINQKINFYISSRMDYIMILNLIPAEGFYGEGKYSANTSSIGINFKKKDFSVFMEFIAFFPIKTYSIRGYIDREGNSIDTIDTLYTERFYSFQLGVSF